MLNVRGFVVNVDEKDYFSYCIVRFVVVLGSFNEKKPIKLIKDNWNLIKLLMKEISCSRV